MEKDRSKNNQLDDGFAKSFKVAGTPIFAFFYYLISS